MRHLFAAVSAAMVILTVAGSAVGQVSDPNEEPASGPVPTLTRLLGLTPQQAECFRVCLGSDRSDRNEAECREAQRRNGAAWRALILRIETIEVAIRGAATREELEALRRELVELRRALEIVATNMVAIEQRLGEVSALAGDLARQLHELQGRIDAFSESVDERLDSLTERVEALEGGHRVTYRPAGLRFVSLFGPQGLRYSGALLSLGGVEFNFTPTFSVALEGGAVIDGSDRPFGTFVEGALGWDIRRPYGVWRLGLGLRGMWTGLDRSLHAQAAFITAAPQASFRPVGAQWLEIFVSIPTGVGVVPDADSPSGHAVRPVVGVEVGVAIRVEFGGGESRVVRRQHRQERRERRAQRHRSAN